MAYVSCMPTTFSDPYGLYDFLAKPSVDEHIRKRRKRKSQPTRSRERPTVGRVCSRAFVCFAAPAAVDGPAPVGDVCGGIAATGVLVCGIYEVCTYDPNDHPLMMTSGESDDVPWETIKDLMDRIRSLRVMRDYFHKLAQEAIQNGEMERYQYYADRLQEIELQIEELQARVRNLGG